MSSGLTCPSKSCFVTKESLSAPFALYKATDARSVFWTC
jgi:hypothetical protein